VGGEVQVAVAVAQLALYPPLGRPLTIQWQRGLAGEGLSEQPPAQLGFRVGARQRLVADPHAALD
jgi:hypothetical protein